MSNFLEGGVQLRMELPEDLCRTLRYHAAARGVDPGLLAAELLREGLQVHFGEAESTARPAQPQPAGPQVLDGRPNLL